VREEIAFLAYHLHWSLDELTALAHGERRSWVEQVSALNAQLNSMAEGA
jgi:hypothetical protein